MLSMVQVRQLKGSFVEEEDAFKLEQEGTLDYGTGLDWTDIVVFKFLVTCFVITAQMTSRAESR